MTQTKTILVTGAAGFIGSHTCVELLAAGYNVVGIDNFCNSSPIALERVEQIAGRAVTLRQGDIRDRSLLRSVFSQHAIDAVIHFAGLKAVGESVAQPLMYFDNNVGGTVVLLEEMATAGVHHFVFSSSATVYGDPETVPIREDARLWTTNPYGASKLMVEQILADLAKAEPKFAIGVLRYFNPVGAHSSGLIGEDPRGVPNNLMPYVAQVAVGRLKQLSVFGSDYPTVDGTGMRDYIHVVDLAIGHVAALRRLFEQHQGFTVNLGTGHGYSVLEVVRAFEQASGRPVPYQLVARRPGDIAKCFADASLAQQLLGWTAQRDMQQMCVDHWRWQSNNPQGFND
ncbi:UDP-glucose 4-epimerase [Actimicrobium sp. GrIS 1.19]|uniref:UDP-glucose 4-epimerase GalE n=1 Tax=Actimicrobium sp. GrIS 1.19 TaxID=3071708 RepID=UPI002E0A483D|nr:UDP-glucose 4-epimerase [Actimicrobium sp. GrIS 1.19]